MELKNFFWGVFLHAFECNIVTWTLALKIYFLWNKVEVDTIYQCDVHIQFGSLVYRNISVYDASLTASWARTEKKVSIYINK